MNFLESLFLSSLAKAWASFLHNWPYLAVGIFSGVLLKTLIEPRKLAGWFNRHRDSGILGATLFAVGTPFCSCGTMAIVLGMLTSVMPWAPIVAFIVASPLTSPEGLFLSAGLFGWEFAIVFFGASIVLGLAGGAAALWLEGRGWLKNQARFFASGDKDAARGPSSHTAAAGACACDGVPVPAAPEISACGWEAAAVAPMQTAGDCCAVAAVPARHAWNLSDLRALAKDVLNTSTRLVPMFLGFAWIGYFLNGLIPVEWMRIVFGQGSHFGVPFAALTGLPFYVNAESSLPLVKTMIEAGMSKGAALAFLITGAGTSIGAITGLLTVARWRVVALAIGTYLAGAIILGAAYNLF
jgi:uncharacterized membrane protein YraQ (UPF0718 family)